MASRYIHKAIERLAFTNKKMAFISGPRQAGKTTVAKALIKERGAGSYANWDDRQVKRIWAKDPKGLLPIVHAEGSTPILALDEIHKARAWKGVLKGVYDTLERPCDIVVTGSARLNIYKKGGDSLLGRYLNFRLHPLTLGELDTPGAQAEPDKFFDAIEREAPKPMRKEYERLWKFGGFPDPYFKGDQEYANIWCQGRVEKIIREDLRDLSRIPELSQVEVLAALLPERAGGLLSVESLREDLDVSHDTVKRWLKSLEDLYYFFSLRPFVGSIPRSLKKEAKAYLWDWSEVESPGPRFENLIALHLLKACHFWTDIGKGAFDLHYLRDKQKREVDFLITRKKVPWFTVEAKLSDSAFEPSIHAFAPKLGISRHVQVVHATGTHRRVVERGLTSLIVSADRFLRLLP